MKNFLSIIVVYAILFASTTIANTYNANTTTSKVEWVGKKVLGQHNGVISFQNGTITLDGDKLTAASFNVDMTTLKVLDLKTAEEGRDKLTGHLKSDDFFSIDKHKTANFTLSSAKMKGSPTKDGNTTIMNFTVTGDLTIKGIKKPITFDVQVKQTGDIVEAYAFLKVDRTKYDIKYGSKSFFEGIGDKAIDNEFTLNLSLQFTK